jgi:hypothetical protein
MLIWLSVEAQNNFTAVYCFHRFIYLLTTNNNDCYIAG